MRLLLLLFLLAACTSPTAAPPATVTPFAISTPVVIATVTPEGAPQASPTAPVPEATATSTAAGLGYVTEQGPSAEMLAALEGASAEQGWLLEVAEGAEALTSLAQAGTPVIVAEGEALAAATRAAAEAFPGVYFVGVNQAGVEPALPNLLTLGSEPAREDQVGFVAGAIGGLLTEGEIVTAIGAPATPAGLKYRNGFLHGIRYTCTRCRVDFINSVDGSSDGNAVAEAARLNANLSSDVVYAAAGPPGVQGLQAAAAQGAWIIGSQAADEAVTFAPGQPGAEQWVTSVYLDPAAGVAAALAAYQAGAPLTGALPWSAASGALVVAPYRLSEDDFSDLDRQDILAVIARLADGSLETGIDPASGQER